MKQYRLKKGQESFQVVDGPLAGRKFLKGQVYAEIPPGEKGRFEEIRPKPFPVSETAPVREPLPAGKGKSEKKEE